MKKVFLLLFVITSIALKGGDSLAYAQVYNSASECKAACTKPNSECKPFSTICADESVDAPGHLSCSNTGACTLFQCEPKPTASPTPPPVCGGPCTPNSTQCPIECPYCFGEFGYNPTCRPAVTQPPEPSPSGPPEKSPTPKTSPTPKSSPTPKVTTTPKPTATPKPSKTPTPSPKATSTPTPTPFPFADAMCKCDGLEIGQVAAGQDLKVTAYGKVEGSDTAYANIKSFRFFVAKGELGSTDITIFNKSGPVASQILSTSQNLIRSKAEWTFKFPANPEVGKEYRIWNDIQCEKKTASSLIASSGRASQNVLAESTKNESLVQKFLNFVLGIFGKSAKPEEKPDGFLVTTQSEDNSQLQLGTFRFGRIIPDPETACYMVKITFDK